MSNVGDVLAGFTYRHVVGLGIGMTVVSIGVEGFFGVKVEVGDRNAVMWGGIALTTLGVIAGIIRETLNYKREQLAVELKKANIQANRPDADNTMIRDLMGDRDD